MFDQGEYIVRRLLLIFDQLDTLRQEEMEKATATSTTSPSPSHGRIS